MESNSESLAMPATTSNDVLTEVLRDAAEWLPAQAIEAEVTSLDTGY